MTDEATALNVGNVYRQVDDRAIGNWNRLFVVPDETDMSGRAYLYEYLCTDRLDEEYRAVPSSAQRSEALRRAIDEGILELVEVDNDDHVDRPLPWHHDSDTNAADAEADS